MTETPRDKGKRLGELCTDKAEETTSFDRTQAAEWILDYLRAVGQPVSGEVLVNYCIASGLVPHDARAFGSIFQRLARAGKIESVGTCARQKGHGTAGALLWKVVRE